MCQDVDDQREEVEEALREPKQIKMKAIDVVPYLYGIYCTVEGDPKPFVNGIVLARWSEEKPGQIIFMLDTHNFDFRMADEEMEVVLLELGEYQQKNRDRYIAEHAAFKAKAPKAEDIRRRTAVKAATAVLKDDNWESVRSAVRILQDALVAEVPQVKTI